MLKKIAFVFSLCFLSITVNATASMIGYADIVLDYYDSGAGPLVGPYGGTLASYPVSVSTDVILENNDTQFLSLPTGSSVTVGFTDETVIDGIGNDIFIKEIGASGELANVFVSSNLIDFVFLGIANDAGTTSFDLNSIGFTDAVQAIQIVGLDNLGGSPGFDVVNIQVLPGSIGDAPQPQPTPEPTTMLLFGLGILGLAGVNRQKTA